jgi:hypothetical protein
MPRGRTALTTRKYQNEDRALSSLKLRRPQTRSIPFSRADGSVVLTASNTSPPRWLPGTQGIPQGGHKSGGTRRLTVYGG